MLQVTADENAACGYRVELRQLGAKSSWHWRYTLHEAGDVALEFVDSKEAVTTEHIVLPDLQMHKPASGAAAVQQQTQRQPLIPVSAVQEARTLDV